MNITSKLFIHARKLFQIVILHLVKINIADPETAEILNNFFSKIVQNLVKWRDNEHVLDNVKDSTIKAIVKYRNHALLP